MMRVWLGAEVTGSGLLGSSQVHFTLLIPETIPRKNCLPQLIYFTLKLKTRAFCSISVTVNVLLK